MEQKLTINQLAPYLPYGLKCRLSHEGMINLDSEYPNEHQHKIGTIKHFSFYEDEFSGSFWVTDNYSFDFQEQSEIEIILRPMSDLKNMKEVVMILRVITDSDLDGLIINPLGSDYQDMMTLFKNHFDVFGLIEKGLAIDKNTLENE